MTENTPTLRRPRWRTPLVVVGLVVTFVVATSAPASAHVGISDATASGDATVVAFAFDHGCDGSATVGMDVQLPPGAVLSAASLPDGWSLAGSDASAAGTSGTVVSVTGTPIPDGTAGGFALTITGYDSAIDHLVPILQKCEQGELAWVDEDQSAANPAPLLVATSSTPTTAGVAPTGAQASSTTEAVAVTTDFVAESTHSGFPWVTVITGFIAGGIAAYVAGVIMRRRRATAD
jgi:uncharacterized protein YcnI